MISSCTNNSDEISPLALFVRPTQEANLTVLQSGEFKPFLLKFYTTGDFARHLSIKAFNTITGERVLLDSTFETKCDSMRYIYRAPELNVDSVVETISFYTYNNESNAEAVRKVAIVKKFLLLQELTGIILRNQDENLGNAMSFKSPSQIFCIKNSPDSIVADLYLECADEFDKLSFKSRTDTKFARYNNFDYPTATALTIQNVFESSNLHDEIYDLKTNDIILVGHGSQADGVILITNIIKSGANTEKCVQLSFKGIDRTQ